MNGFLVVFNGVMANGSFACLNGAIVLAPLIQTLTGSTAWAGSMYTLGVAAMTLPQLLVSGYTESRPYKLPVYKLGSYFRSFGWLFGALLLFIWGPELAETHGLWLAVGVTLSVILAGLANGFTFLAFQDVVAKVIPAELRERYFGMRLFWGRALQIALTISFMPWVLGATERFPFPQNYALLFAASFVFVALAVGSFWFIKEPAGSSRPGQTLRGQFAAGLELLRTNRNFKQLLAFRLLNLFGTMSHGVVTVFALDALSGLGVAGDKADADYGRLAAHAQSLFMLAMVVAECLAAGAWGWLVGRFSVGTGMVLGTAVRLVLSVGAAAAGPVLRALGADHGACLAVVCGLYVLQGISAVTLFIEIEALVLDLAPEDKRPTFVGFLNALAFLPTVLCPILGGLLAQYLGYEVAFGAMAVFNVAALFVARNLGVLKAAARGHDIE